VTAPACRDCRGAGIGDVSPGGAPRDCERCNRCGVETCGECVVGAPRARVVAAYADTCADGSPYKSQVCTDCARRLVGLIEMPAPCRWCGYTQRGGEAWGHLDGPWCAEYCHHIHAQRRCESCTSDWWAPWLDSEWDIDGCAKQTCPECVAAFDAEAAIEPRVTQVYLQSPPSGAVNALAVALAAGARPVAGDGYRVIAMQLLILVLSFCIGLAACGDNVSRPPSGPAVSGGAGGAGGGGGAGGASSAAPCTDVVIWQSPAEDCLAAGGSYERKVWPINNGTEQPVCDFCGGNP